jgi:anti-anti-sigma factor
MTGLFPFCAAAETRLAWRVDTPIRRREYASRPVEQLEPRIALDNDGDDLAVVSVIGEHDLSTSDQLRIALEDTTAAGRSCVVDLTQTTFLDSSCVQALLGAYELGLRRGRAVVLVVTDAQDVWRVLDFAGVLTTVPSASTRAEAISAARAAGPTADIDSVS